MARIAFFETKPWEERYLASMLKKHKLRFFSQPIDGKPPKDTEYLSVFIYSRVDSKVIASLPRLKMIATRSTGFDHIDLNSCKDRRIIVSNVPYYGENTVAEHTFSLILSLSRNIHKSYMRTQCDDFSIDGLTGFDLKGRTIGIIGGGHIGMHVARMAKGFGMKVLVYDINRDNFLSEVMGFDYCTLEELLRVSDIITCHVPYNERTHHLLDKKKLGTVKKGAVIINTSRGGIIDTDALFDALKHGSIGGAGLDVIEGEEFIKEEKELLHSGTHSQKWREFVRDHEIFHMENVVFTPHNAFNSKEALQRILDTTIENINSAIEDRPLNKV